MNPRTLAPKLLIAALIVSTALVGGVGTTAAEYTTPTDAGGGDGQICWTTIHSPDGEFHPEHDHIHEASTVCRTYGD